MKHLVRLTIVFAGLLTGACQFFSNPAEATLVAQNQQLSTEIAAIRETATVDADRMMITLEYAQTAVRNINNQTDGLAATLVARGTPADALTIAQITPQPPITVTAPQLVDIAPQAPAETQEAAAPTVPVAAQSAPDGTPNLLPSLFNAVTASGVGPNDCPTDTRNAFTTDNSEIYVVAVANNLGPEHTVTTRWRRETEEVIRYDWTPDFLIEDACIWFFIDQTDVDFTPGGWSVQFEVNGSIASPEIPFTIAGDAPADGGGETGDYGDDYGNDYGDYGGYGDDYGGYGDSSGSAPVAVTPP